MRNLGIIGCGNIAKTMADTVNKMENTTLYAVSSRSYDKAKKFASEFNCGTFYGSYEELVKDENVDLVYVATPHSHHYQSIKLALENNKNVLCEKAFTANSKMAEELLEMAKSRKLLLAEAIWTRYLPSRSIISKILDSGVLGKISYVDSNLGYNIQNNERIIKKELAGGALLDLSVYPINFALMFFPSTIKKVESSMVCHPSTGVDAMENISIQYENGMLATCRTSIYCSTDRRGLIYGENGYLEITNINNPERIVLYNNSYEKVKEYEIPKQISGFEYEVSECFECIEKGLLQTPSMPHSEIIKVLRICDGLRKDWGYEFPFE